MSIHTVILAAGKGTRMKSTRLKVLHQMGGISLLEHVVRLSQSLKVQKTVVVTPKQGQSLQESLSGPKVLQKKLSFAVQSQQLGTGDALKSALKALPGTGTVLVLSGDMPLIRPQSLRKLLKAHTQKKAKVSLLTGQAPTTSSFGRVLRQGNQVQGIVEFKDATVAQRQITEVNLGVYVFDISFVRKNITQIKNKNKQKEYYLPDLLAMAARQNQVIVGQHLADTEEALGVNSQIDLHKVNQVYYQRRREQAMASGVSCIGDQIFIDSDVSLKAGVHLESPCYLKGETRLAEGVVVENGCTLKSAVLGPHSLLKSGCYLDQVRVGPHCQIGPFAHLRPGTVLSAKAKIGNFVETKKTQVGEGSKINHLSYVGDAKLGKAVNVGAGTITCNYDGFNKFKTVLEDGVFIGSDTQLVAPVTVKKGAFVGAGTTVTKDVGADSLAVSRCPQREIPGWGRRKRQKSSKK